MNTSAKPSSGRYAAAANDDGRLAIPTHPKEPSCQAISIHVSIISANDGSTPPAATGLNADISPLAHISSTIAGKCARLFGFGGLGQHEVPHPPCQTNNPVSRFDCRRHALTITTSAGEFRYQPKRNFSGP